MANIGHKKKFNEHKAQIICSATKLFLQKGYTLTTVSDIAKEAKVDKNTVFYIFKDKETLLSMIVKHVLECQYSTVNKIVKNLSSDKIYLYAVETTLQMYIAESSEHLREMYNVAYSLQKTSEVVYQTVTEKLYDIFGDLNLNYEMKDFYEIELAVGGMMRSFMTVPCDMYFTIERKVKRFLESVLLLFRISDDKIQQAYEFASQFDYVKLTEDTINNLLAYVQKKVMVNILGE